MKEVEVIVVKTTITPKSKLPYGNKKFSIRHERVAIPPELDCSVLDRMDNGLNALRRATESLGVL